MHRTCADPCWFNALSFCACACSSFEQGSPHFYFALQRRKRAPTGRVWGWQAVRKIQWEGAGPFKANPSKGRMAGSSELAYSLCDSRSHARVGVWEERNLTAWTNVFLGGVGHWWELCPGRPLPAVLQPGVEAQRLAVVKPTIMAGRVGLFNTLLTGSPWQPGARLVCKHLSPWRACVLKVTSHPSSRRYKVRAGAEPNIFAMTEGGGTPPTQSAAAIPLGVGPMPLCPPKNHRTNPCLPGAGLTGVDILL